MDSLRILQMEIFFKQKRYYGIKCKQVDNAKDFIQYKIKSVEAAITDFTKLKGQASWNSEPHGTAEVVLVRDFIAR